MFVGCGRLAGIALAECGRQGQVRAGLAGWLPGSRLGATTGVTSSRTRKSFEHAEAPRSDPTGVGGRKSLVGERSCRCHEMNVLAGRWRQNPLIDPLR